MPCLEISNRALEPKPIKSCKSNNIEHSNFKLTTPRTIFIRMECGISCPDIFLDLDYNIWRIGLWSPLSSLSRLTFELSVWFDRINRPVDHVLEQSKETKRSCHWVIGFYIFFQFTDPRPMINLKWPVGISYATMFCWKMCPFVDHRLKINYNFRQDRQSLNGH